MIWREKNALYANDRGAVQGSCAEKCDLCPAPGVADGQAPAHRLSVARGAVCGVFPLFAEYFVLKDPARCDHRQRRLSHLCGGVGGVCPFGAGGEGGPVGGYAHGEVRDQAGAEVAERPDL